MTLVRSAVAALLLLVLCPGVGELAENAGYLLSHGHLAHASSDDHDDHPAGPEHGCTGTFHMCPCHSTPLTLLPTADLKGPAHLRADVIAEQRFGTGAGISGEVYRPPRVG